MRKVFLDDLPRRGTKYINWNESVGSKVNFEYDELNGELEILEVLPNRYLKIRFDKSESVIGIGHLKKGQIGRIVGKYAQRGHVTGINDIPTKEP